MQYFERPGMHDNAVNGDFSDAINHEALCKRNIRSRRYCQEKVVSPAVFQEVLNVGRNCGILALTVGIPNRLGRFRFYATLGFDPVTGSVRRDTDGSGFLTSNPMIA